MNEDLLEQVESLPLLFGGAFRLPASDLQLHEAEVARSWYAEAVSPAGFAAHRQADRPDLPEVSMACRGVFFAITEEQAATLQAAPDDDALLSVVEEIEEAWDRDNLAECDKAWDAMHRLLTDGALQFGNGPEPFCHCVLGPLQLHEGDDYIVSLVPPDKVKEVAAALAAIDKPWFDERYRTTVPSDYAPEYGDDDREYTWNWFEGVRDLYQRAATRGRWIVFTVDQ